MPYYSPGSKPNSYKVNGAKPKTRGEGNRIMYTESPLGWDAKNRF
jgi:hypothetical protein